jgi:hypothetical protein
LLENAPERFHERARLFENLSSTEDRNDEASLNPQICADEGMDKPRPGIKVRGFIARFGLNLCKSAEPAGLIVPATFKIPGKRVRRPPGAEQQRHSDAKNHKSHT